MHSTIMDPTVGMFGGSIVEPIGVRTMDIHITMGDIIDPIPMEDIIIPTPMGDIIDLIPMEDIIVRTNFRPLSACASSIVVHKKPRGLNYARQAFDDWCCRRDHHDPPQRCPPKSGALPASRRQHCPQLVRRALPGAAHEAHHPKLATGAPSKLSTARIAWPGRSDPASAWMFRTDARQAKCVQGLVQDRARRPGRDRDAGRKRMDPAAAHRTRGARLLR